MSEKKIEITVNPEGAVSIKTTGFTGGSCRDATRELERALGHERTGEPAAGVLCQKRQLRADSAEGLKEQGRGTDWDKGQRAQGL